MSEILSRSLDPNVIAQIEELTGGNCRVGNIGADFARMARRCFASEGGIGGVEVEPQLADIEHFADFTLRSGNPNTEAVGDLLDHLSHPDTSVESALLHTAVQRGSKMTTEQVVKAFALKAEFERQMIESVATQCEQSGKPLPTEAITNNPDPEIHRWLLEQYSFGWWRIMLASGKVGARVRGVAPVTYDELNARKIYEFMEKAEPSDLVTYIRHRAEHGGIALPPEATFVT